MALVIDRPNFQLDATIEASGPLFNLELHQLFPEAQRPHWRRLVQLNLTRDELTTLGRHLLETVHD